MSGRYLLPSVPHRPSMTPFSTVCRRSSRQSLRAMPTIPVTLTTAVPWSPPGKMAKRQAGIDPIIFNEMNLHVPKARQEINIA